MLGDRSLLDPVRPRRAGDASLRRLGAPAPEILAHRAQGARFASSVRARGAWQAAALAVGALRAKRAWWAGEALVQGIRTAGVSELAGGTRVAGAERDGPFHAPVLPRRAGAACGATRCPWRVQECAPRTPEALHRAGVRVSPRTADGAHLDARATRRAAVVPWSTGQASRAQHRAVCKAEAACRASGADVLLGGAQSRAVRSRDAELAALNRVGALSGTKRPSRAALALRARGGALAHAIRTIRARVAVGLSCSPLCGAERAHGAQHAHRGPIFRSKCPSGARHTGI